MKLKRRQNLSRGRKGSEEEVINKDMNLRGERERESFCRREK